VNNPVGVVVGVGSVGKLHALALSKFFSELILVDPNVEVKMWANSNIKTSFTFHTDIDVLDSFGYFPSNSVAIISNWGPDHFKTFKFLVSLGFKRIICEKPLTNSIYLSNRVRQISKKNKVKIIYGITRRYNGFTEKVKEIFEIHCGKEIKSISVIGGAQCLITSGIHWFDFACQIKDSVPVLVFSDLRSNSTNPRNKNLGYWEGVSYWKFKDCGTLTLSYSNTSFVRSGMRLLGEIGFLDINSNGEIDIYAVTKSPEPSQKATMTSEYRIVKKLNINDFVLQNPFEKQIELLVSDREIPYSLEEVVKIYNSFVGTLISTTKKRPIKLPIKRSSPMYYKKWPIS
jgi:predicted dehydrogenase